MGRFISHFCIFLLKLYHLGISPVLGNHCRFYPTCSVYAEMAVREHGIVKGFYLIVHRILKCHPWHVGGFDPVPKHKC